MDGGWWSLPQRELENYAVHLDQLQAQEDLRQVNINWINTPSYTQGEVNAKTEAIRNLQSRAYGQGEGFNKSMSGKDLVAQVALNGGEVFTGPAFDHGIGRKRKSDFE